MQHFARVGVVDKLLANQLDYFRCVIRRALHGQANAGTVRSRQPFAEIDDVFVAQFDVVDLQDDIVWLQAGAGCWRPRKHCRDANGVVVERMGQADSDSQEGGRKTVLGATIRAMGQQAGCVHRPTLMQECGRQA